MLCPFFVQKDARRGFTIVEMLVVVAIVGIVALIAVVRGGALRDGAAVRAAAMDAEELLEEARTHAVAWRGAVGVRIDTAAGRIEVRRGGDLVLAAALRDAYGVRVGASRDSIAYDARGLGRGAANVTLVLRRGAAVESLVVSRLGRVRR